MTELIKFRRLTKELISGFLTHQAWKAHEGLFMPVSLDREEARVDSDAPDAESRRRSLRKLTGIRLSASEAGNAWPLVLEHKWYLGERLGRDVGLRVAAVDYFENIRPPRTRSSVRANRDGLPPRLPMMMPFGQTS